MASSRTTGTHCGSRFERRLKLRERHVEHRRIFGRYVGSERRVQKGYGTDNPTSHVNSVFFIGILLHAVIGVTRPL
jgi:hypothetical protein